MLVAVLALLSVPAAEAKVDLALEPPRLTATRVQRIAWDTPGDECCTASQLSVIPLGAEDCWVTVGELDLGYAPFFKRPVPAGECVTRIQCEDGHRWSGKVLLRPGAAERVLIRSSDWESTSATSQLSLIALGETRCEGKLGQQELGALPFFGRDVPDGSWSIDVRCESGRSYHLRLDLQAGQHHRVIVGNEEWAAPALDTALPAPPGTLPGG